MHVVWSGNGGSATQLSVLSDGYYYRTSCAPAGRRIDHEGYGDGYAYGDGAGGGRSGKRYYKWITWKD